jgi:hypothetical protein
MRGAEAGTDTAPASPAVNLDEDVAPYPEDIRFRNIPRLAVERPSPLTCPNQDIVRARPPR